MDLTPLPEHNRPRFSEQLPNMEAGPLIYAFPLQALQRGGIEMLNNGNNLDIFQELSLQMGGAWDVQFQAIPCFFTSFSSILNRKYLLLHCCCFSGGTFVSETVDWNAKGSPSLAILRRDHAQVLWALAQLPPTQVIHLAPQLFWACWHRWWSDQGADEGIGSAGVRGSEDLCRTSSGCLVSGTCTQALAQAQAVSSQVIAQPRRRLSLFTFLYISCVHQASFYVSPVFLCLRL